MNRSWITYVVCTSALGALLLSGCPSGTTAGVDGGSVDGRSMDSGAMSETDAGPDPCLGCLDGTECRLGFEDTACGRGGGACVACAADELCIDATCEVVGACASTCSGCCDGETCLFGDEDTGCGSAGLACQACAADETCVAGVCELPCEATCAGCCTADGVCLGGAADAACGAGGETCVACASSEGCSAGTCVDTSCAATCAGCCNGDVCEGGTLADACGSGGAACTDCGSSFVCGGGATCEADPTSRWDLIIVSATVPSTNWTGVPWDAGGGLPDVYAEARVFDSPDTYAGRTETDDDDLTPFWTDRALDAVPARGLMSGSGIAIRLYDDDLVGDDEMTRCSLVPTAAQLDGRNITVDCPARPPSDPSGPAVAASVVVRLVAD